MAMEIPTGNLQYRTMVSAPMDGTVVMGLCQRKHPQAVYFSAGAWHFWHLAANTACAPDYWCRMPGDQPADYFQADVATP